MFYPSFSEVLELKSSATLIPISQKVWSDNVTPIRLFQQIKGPYSFLLESVEGGEKWARYSFIGDQPFLIFSARDGKAYLEEGKVEPKIKVELEGHPRQLLQELLRKYKAPESLKLPRFSGGAVGYIGYDAVSLIENIPAHMDDSLQQDQMRLMFCDDIIAFDHLQQEITFISHLFIEPGQDELEIQRNYERVCQRLKERVDQVFQKLQKDHLRLFQAPTEKIDVDWERVQSNFSKETFIEAVEQVKEYIRAGDIFQTVLSQRFALDIETDPFNLYRVLRVVNPSPYLYYLDLGDGSQLVGSSPERLVQLEEGKVETNPIAGTRHRGKTVEEDHALAEDLLADEKERAEHHMLLDLGRNDIGRISEYGSVTVKKKMEIERFSHVMHIVSTVEGQIKKDVDAVDCLFSCFPAGTVSGAPKIRAMEIIAELEREARNTYAGAIGYFSFSGNLDSCITIRTILVHEGKAYVQAGAGIVADSVPEKEWEETRNKAKALLVAIQMADELFQNKGEGESIYV